MTARDASELVSALEAVPGVQGAAVEPDGTDGLGMLRLGLAPGVDEASVASDVGRVLREQFGLGVDAEHVQVVEDAEIGQNGVPEQRLAQRPSIARMHLVSSGLDVVATVTLTSHGRTAQGESRGAASVSGVHRAVAHATLRAVESLAQGRVRVELDHLDVANMGTDRTVVVALTLLTLNGTQRLTGAAAVREDVRQAVIRATLDALNRRLETLLPE